ncbi:uncharacterized protein V1518DRAFT_422364 [Limtongia smithiae]|uniref:uncharacterized protein n=1 Tax=Limtongia smithiae TaxID=1125753 RepID=UPI0034CFFA56
MSIVISTVSSCSRASETTSSFSLLHCAHSDSRDSEDKGKELLLHIPAADAAAAVTTEKPDESAIVLPVFITHKIPSIVCSAVSYSDSYYVIPGFSYFVPKYANKQHTYLTPFDDTDDHRGDAERVQLGIIGQLAYVPKACLNKLDAFEEEGRAQSRVTCVAKNADDLDGPGVDVEVYVWNGNCTAGEWEYL